MTCSVLPLFSSPIYVNKELDINVEIFSSLLDKLEYEMTPNGDGWISKNQFLLLEDQFSFIREKVESNLKSYLHDVLKVSKNYKLKHSCSWSIYHEKGNWCRPHLHTNSLFSGVLYFSTPINSGGYLSFSAIRQVPSWSPPTMEPTVDEYNIFNSKSWDIPLEPGLVCIFPSHVLHQVSASQTNERRRCISFNYFLEGEFGDKTNYTKF